MSKRTLPVLKEDNIIIFIKNYRNSLDDVLVNEHEFTTKFYLMPKIGNHKNSSDYAIEYIKQEDITQEYKQKLNNLIIGIKTKNIETEMTKYLPSQVVKSMNDIGYKMFKMPQHTKLWKENDAKNLEKKFGVDIADKWYWYETWLQFVKQHCNDNLKQYD